MLTALFDTYVDQQPPHHSLKLSQVLITVIVATFAFSAVSLGYAAGRQSDPPAPTTVEVAPAS